MRFRLPDKQIIKNITGPNAYAVHNYFGKGPISWVKRQRFQKALNLGSKIASTGTIDYGCADGVLLPTLSDHYDQVVAIDINSKYIQQSQDLVDACNLSNVVVLSNKELTNKDITNRIGNGFKIMWLLETLEHIGRQPDMWESKSQFLESCFELLDDDGHIVITVPKMVGLGFLVKYIIQNVFLRVKHDRMEFSNLLKSVFLKNTDALESRWNGGHVGFNHLKLDKVLAKNFKIVRRQETLISCLYLVRRR